MSTAASRHRLWPPDPMIVAVAALVLLAETAFVVVHVQTFGVGVTRPLVAFGVPFVWINASLLAVAVVRPGPDAGRRLPAAIVAGGYLAVLAVAGGLVTWGPAGTGGPRVILQAVPGWSPLVVVPGAVLNLVVLPWKAIGYLALAFLVYVTVRDASGALVGGLVGLFSCVSCTFPVIAAILSSLAGGGGAAATVAYSNSYLLSTAVFVVTVGLLAWRPSAGALRALWPR